MTNKGYFEKCSADEQAFWAAPATGGLLQTARAWKTGPGVWYLSRALWVRLVWPWVRLGGFAALAVLLFALFLHFKG